jgi:ankyrin repeat protein
MLLKFGADLEAENIIGEKPISLAGVHEIVELLTDFAQYSKEAEEESLFQYCWLGQIVKLHRKCDGDANLVDKHGSGGLHYAAVRDHVQAAGMLISAGVDINATNEKGNAALHEVCRFSSPETLRLLLEAGAIYSILNNSGHSPIYYASKSLRRVFRKFARDKGINDPDFLLAVSTQRYVEVSEGDDDEDDETEESGIMINHRLGGLTREERKLQQMLAIFSRSVSGEVESKRKKLSNRARPQNSGIVTEEEMTPPRPSRPRNYGRQTRIDPTYVDKASGRTQLHKFAARGKLTEMTDLLKIDDSLIQRTDNGGYLALHEACLGGQLEAVKALIEAGSNINAPSNNGDTPLHDAAENAHGDIVKYLVSKGADTKAKNKNGDRPIDVSKDAQIVDILRGTNKTDSKSFDARNSKSLEGDTKSYGADSKYNDFQSQKPHNLHNSKQQQGSESEEAGTPRRSSRRAPIEAGLDKLFGKTNGRKIIEIVTNEPLVQLHCGATDMENAGWYYLGAQADALFQKSFHPLRLQDSVPLSKRRHLSPEETDRLLDSAIVDRLGSFRKYLVTDPILLTKDSVQRAFDRAGGSLANVPVLYADLQRLARRPDEETAHLPPKLKMKWQRKSAENPV